MLSVLVLHLASVLTLSIVIRCIFGARRIHGIPYHWFLWWLPTGSLVELAIHFYLSGQVFDWFSYQSFRHNSSIVQLFMPSLSMTKPVIVISDLREVEHIVTRRIHEIDRSSLVHGFFKLFARCATIGMKTRSDNSREANHHTFKQQRKLWNCMVTPRMIEQVAAPALHRAVLRMVQLWELKAQAAPGYAFHIDLDLRQATLEGMWDMLTADTLGVCKSAQNSVKYSTDKNIALDRKKGEVSFNNTVTYPELYRALSTIFTCLDWVTTGFSPQFYTWVFEYTWILSSADKVKDRVLGHIIDTARSRISRTTSKNDSLSSCVLDEVLSRDADSAEKSVAPVSDDTLKDELMELLITGHETTASATGWALKYLADNQHTQQRLWQSMAALFPSVSCGILPSAKEILKADMPYLDAVIAETLRMSSTGPVSFRETIRDCQILGHSIEAGTQLILITGGPWHDNGENAKSDVVEKHDSRMMQAATCEQEVADPKASGRRWAPTVFAPDRWIASDGKFDPQAYPNLPFSAGPRGCFGKKIALLDLRIMLVMIVLNFKMPKLAPSLSEYTSRDSLTRKPTCCYIRPEKRMSALTSITYTAT